MRGDHPLWGPALLTDFSPVMPSPGGADPGQAFLTICWWNVVGQMLQKQINKKTNTIEKERKRECK